MPLFLLQTGQVLVGLNGFGGEAVVLPPVHQRRCHRDAGAYQLLQLFGLDGQHGMAGTAQQLVGQGQRQRGGAGMVEAEILQGFFIEGSPFLFWW